MNEIIYSRISQPREIRRNLLLNSKSIIDHLKSIEEFKFTKEEKLREVTKLKKSVNELSSLIHKLKNKLPSIPSQKPPTYPSPPEDHAQSSPQAEPYKSTLEMIEEELAKLEKSLD